MDTSTANKTCTQTSCCREGRRITRVYLQRKRTPGRDSVGRGAAQSDGGGARHTPSAQVLAVLALLTPLSQSVVALLACRRISVLAVTRESTHSHSVGMIRVGMKLTGVAAVAVAVLMGASSMKPHSEEALLSDWSAPPPVRGLPFLPIATRDSRGNRCPCRALLCAVAHFHRPQHARRRSPCGLERAHASADQDAGNVDGVPPNHPRPHRAEVQDPRPARLRAPFGGGSCGQDRQRPRVCRAHHVRVRREWRVQAGCGSAVRQHRPLCRAARRPPEQRPWTGRP